MGTYPRPAHRNLAQQSVEIGAATSLVNRVDPDQHAIDARLIPNLR